MTKRSGVNAAQPTDRAKTMVVEQSPSETPELALARTLLGTDVRHGVVASTYADRLVTMPGEVQPGPMDYAEFVREIAEQAEAGNLGMASRMLAAQAVTLDAMFTELARRTALNVGEHLAAVDRYGRLALKAQANSKAALEALAKFHQPREQTVRHVHVNDGGQAVVADQVHHHGRGPEK